jgi:lysophospholipase L1-like esterase
MRLKTQIQKHEKAKAGITFRSQLVALVLSLGVICCTKADTTTSGIPSSTAPPEGSSAGIASANVSTTIPSDSNYKAHYLWNKACEDQVAAIKGKPCDIIFVGDSITQNFIGKPTPKWGSVGGAVWDKYYANRNALDFGVGADTTQNVLWRLEHMNIKDFKPKVAVILIGTNNTKNVPAEIAAGVRAVVDKTQQLFPASRIILVSILPNARATQTMADTDKIIQTFADNTTVYYLDLAAKMPPVGNSWKGLGPDRLHLSPEGYELWASEMEPLLSKLIKEQP